MNGLEIGKTNIKLGLNKSDSWLLRELALKRVFFNPQWLHVYHDDYHRFRPNGSCREVGSHESFLQLSSTINTLGQTRARVVKKLVLMNEKSQQLQTVSSPRAKRGQELMRVGSRENCLLLSLTIIISGQTRATVADSSTIITLGQKRARDVESWLSWEFSLTLIDYHHLGPNEDFSVCILRFLFNSTEPL